MLAYPVHGWLSDTISDMRTKVGSFENRTKYLQPHRDLPTFKHDAKQPKPPYLIHDHVLEKLVRSMFPPLKALVIAKVVLIAAVFTQATRPAAKPPLRPERHAGDATPSCWMSQPLLIFDSLLDLLIDCKSSLTVCLQVSCTLHWLFKRFYGVDVEDAHRLSGAGLVEERGEVWRNGRNLWCRWSAVAVWEMEMDLGWVANVMVIIRVVMPASLIGWHGRCAILLHNNDVLARNGSLDTPNCDECDVPKHAESHVSS